MTVTPVTVVSSVYALSDVRQRENRVWVTETHTLSDNSIQTFEYLAEGDLTDMDFTRILNERAASINDALNPPE